MMDPGFPILGGAALLLTFVALAASYVPARRLASIQRRRFAMNQRETLR